ncbi:MAG: protein kinase, partial [Pseudomonadota bacterium]
MVDVNLEQQALNLLERALDQPSVDRSAWIRKEAEGNPRLRDRVLSLLQHDAKAELALKTGGAIFAAEDAPPPDKVGAYEIRSVVGRGGMGTVYQGARAVGDFDHTVAIKVIRTGLLQDELTQRFVRERQILAGLNHPNIARLYDGGTLPDGAPYIVMEYVEGLPVTEWARHRDLGTEEKLSLMLTICE